jgi:rhodanese-related sulfurtransferase
VGMDWARSAQSIPTMTTVSSDGRSAWAQFLVSQMCNFLAWFSSKLDILIKDYAMDFISQFLNQPSINQLEPAQVQTMAVQSPRPFLLDVRTPGEFRQAHIQGAELIPLDELSGRLAKIPKGREIICICESGSRSSTAARMLNAQGYKVSNMRGGMSRWVRAGLPVKTGLAK